MVLKMGYIMTSALTCIQDICNGDKYSKLKSRGSFITTRDMVTIASMEQLYKHHEQTVNLVRTGSINDYGR